MVVVGQAWVMEDSRCRAHDTQRHKNRRCLKTATCAHSSFMAQVRKVEVMRKISMENSTETTMPECSLVVGAMSMNAIHRMRWVTAVTIAMVTCTVTKAVQADQWMRTCMRKTPQAGSDPGRKGQVEGGEEGERKTLAEVAASLERETISKDVGAVFIMVQLVPLILAGGACMEGEGGVGEGGVGEDREGEGGGKIRSLCGQTIKLKSLESHTVRLDRETGCCK